MQKSLKITIDHSRDDMMHERVLSLSQIRDELQKNNRLYAQVVSVKSETRYETKAK